MTRKPIFLLWCTLQIATWTCNGAETVTNASDLAHAAYVEPREWVPFDLTAKVTFTPLHGGYTIGVEDSSGSVILHEGAFWPQNPLKAGDVIRARGLTCRSDRNPVFAETRQVDILRHETPSPPVRAEAADLLRGAFDFRLVRIDGIVRNAFRDEIDPEWSFIILGCGRDTVYLSFASRDRDGEAMKKLIGANVSAVGLASPVYSGLRHHVGRSVWITGLDALSASKTDPSAIPGIETLRERPHAEITALGRHRATGRVSAVWQRTHLLLRTGDDRILRADLTDGPPPVCGDLVEAVGFPETDLYRINLTQCTWRKLQSPPAPAAADIPTNIAVATLLEDTRGRRKFNAEFHGRAIRIRGTVSNLPMPDNDDGRMYLRCERSIVPVDVSARPDALDGVTVGCEVEVAGICIMETENWSPSTVFPHIRGFTLVVRTPDDVAVVSRPPWWTPGRLMVVIGSLLAALIGIFAWNRMLNRIAERRGRELLRAQLGQVKADLRTEERTRLAVELHDTLAQNLTGVSMEIEAANDLRGDAPQPMLDHLGIAAKALKSCRDELRNGLGDLRSQALEEPDMTKAVLKTLQPVVNDSRLAVRFNVPRARLSDNTAHALLRVIRELVVNAIRHGNASSVRVAGTIDRGKLLCSVTDDGRGFDPDTAPGVLQGHFGLQGIQERIDEIGGEFSIRSSSDKGTKATISIPIPHDA